MLNQFSNIDRARKITLRAWKAKKIGVETIVWIIITPLNV